MGGNATQDKYGRPYELRDSKEQLYDALHDTRVELEDALDLLDGIRQEFENRHHELLSLIEENKILKQQLIQMESHE